MNNFLSGKKNQVENLSPFQSIIFHFFPFIYLSAQDVYSSYWLFSLKTNIFLITITCKNELDCTYLLCLNDRHSRTDKNKICDSPIYFITLSKYTTSYQAVTWLAFATSIYILFSDSPHIERTIIPVSVVYNCIYLSICRIL